jgi:hypothetical protein
MKLKLRAVFLLTFISLTVFMILAEIIIMSEVGKPYIAERMATDVCVLGSVRWVLVGNFKPSSILKCTSKETNKEINVPSNIHYIGNALMFLIAIPIAFFTIAIMVLGEKLFFKQNVPT